MDGQMNERMNELYNISVISDSPSFVQNVSDFRNLRHFRYACRRREMPRRFGIWLASTATRSVVSHNSTCHGFATGQLTPYTEWDINQGTLFTLEFDQNNDSIYNLCSATYNRIHNLYSVPCNTIHNLHSAPHNIIHNLYSAPYSVKALNKHIKLLLLAEKS